MHAAKWTQPLAACSRRHRQRVARNSWAGSSTGVSSRRQAGMCAQSSAVAAQQRSAGAACRGAMHDMHAMTNVWMQAAGCRQSCSS